MKECSAKGSSESYNVHAIWTPKGLLRVVNVSRSVHILHILPVHTEKLTVLLPAVWLTMGLLPGPDHNVVVFFYF